MDESGSLLMDYMLPIGAIVISLLTLLHTVRQTGKHNKRLEASEKKQTQLDERSFRLEADIMFEKVRNKKFEFELAIGELAHSEEIEKNKESFLKAKTMFSSLYTEIDAYCIRLNDETLPENDYVIKEVIPFFVKMASIQADYFQTLNNLAIKMKLPRFNQPDRGAYKNLNVILNKHCRNGEYEKIQEKRKNARLYL